MNLRTYDNIRKIATGQEDYYTISCLLYYQYYKGFYKRITRYLNKQQVLNVNPKKLH